MWGKESGHYKQFVRSYGSHWVGNACRAASLGMWESEVSSYHSIRDKPQGKRMWATESCWTPPTSLSPSSSHFTDKDIIRRNEMTCANFRSLIDWTMSLQINIFITRGANSQLFLFFFNTFIFQLWFHIYQMNFQLRTLFSVWVLGIVRSFQMPGYYATKYVY